MGNILDKETMGPQTRRIHNWIYWGLTIIFFIVIIVYAGWRGHYAYQKNPATTVTFQPKTEIAFPVITFCPLVPIPMVAVDCELEKDDAFVASCMNTMSTSQLRVESKIHQCLTFNTQGNLKSNSLVDEIAIEVYLNSSLLPAGDEIIGCFVIIHEYGTNPALEVESSFVVDVEKTYEAYMRLDEIITLSGAKEYDYKSTVGGASNRDPTMKDSVDVDFWFNPQGIFVNQQFLAYNVDMWIGEVGGFTCLLTFLHYAVLCIVIAIYRRITNEPVRFNDQPMGQKENI